MRTSPWWPWAPATATRQSPNPQNQAHFLLDALARRQATQRGQAQRRHTDRRAMSERDAQCPGFQRHSAIPRTAERHRSELPRDRSPRASGTVAPQPSPRCNWRSAPHGRRRQRPQNRRGRSLGHRYGRLLGAVDFGGVTDRRRRGGLVSYPPALLGLGETAEVVLCGSNARPKSHSAT